MLGTIVNKSSNFSVLTPGYFVAYRISCGAKTSKKIILKVDFCISSILNYWIKHLDFQVAYF